jgi:hypothetical protein
MNMFQTKYIWCYVSDVIYVRSWNWLHISIQERRYECKDLHLHNIYTISCGGT